VVCRAAAPNLETRSARRTVGRHRQPSARSRSCVASQVRDTPDRGGRRVVV